MWPESDKTLQLLDGVRSGSEDAVNALMDRHRESVRRMVQMQLDRAITRRVDASDVVQDVLLEASGRLQNYLANPVMPFHLWLRQLAKDRITDMRRRHRGAQRRSVDRELNISSLPDDQQSAADLATLLRDAELTPAAAAMQKELNERFFQTLSELEDSDREIIVMRYFEHLTNSEVAQALGITEPAAGMRHLRALRKLSVLRGEE